MPVTFGALAGEYSALWRAMSIDKARDAEFGQIAARLHARIGMYRAVADATGVPAAVVAVIHERESGQDFSTHLHNGHPLAARTVHVPAGRPPAPASPPFTWEESAVDALACEGLDKVRAGNWSVERAAFVLEGYNGFGYRNRGLRSPYLWGGSNQQQPGKYVADGQFDPAAIDRQPGCMPLLAKLFALDPALGLPAAGAAEPTPIPRPPSRPIPSRPPLPPAPTPARRGLIAAIVAALTAAVVAFGHTAFDWLHRLLGG